jgi:peptide/nickel transport system permease protein
MTQYSTLSTATTAPVEASVMSRTLRGLWTFSRRHPLSAFWGVIAVAILVVTIIAPSIVPFDPLKANFRRMTKPPSFEAGNYFGTDQIGRDSLSRVI